jgi:D-alanyl-D-alanine carboxypeptidase
MAEWLTSALEYITQWIDYQRKIHDQPGVSLAVDHAGELVLEHASGCANLATEEKLTPRHRFRVASHSKSFTAAGVMLLREHGQITLDDRLDRFVSGLTPEVGGATISQLLSHSSGLTRDGPDAGQFQDHRDFLSEAELRADLAQAQPLEAGSMMKYSNHGFALLGKVIECITGERYCDWMQREIAGGAGLKETTPDYSSNCVPFAFGHSTQVPFGQRYVIPGISLTNAMAPATGFTATAADLARFFGKLAPNAQKSVLSASSRREMTRRHWRDAHSQIERYYGLGISSGEPGPWGYFGHGGGFQGTISRTGCLAEQEITVSVITNAIDGHANIWFESIVQILKTMHGLGAPGSKTRDWHGRWWSIWGAMDLVPGREKVLVALPAENNPFFDASEIQVTGKDIGKVVKSQAYGRFGEACQLVRGTTGDVEQVRIGGGLLVRVEALVAEVTGRYQQGTTAATKEL